VLALLLMLPAEPALSVDQRSPMVVLVTAKGRAEREISELIAAAAAAIEPHTALRLRSIDAMVADESALRGCPEEERLGCWVLAVRSDYAAGGSSAERRRQPADPGRSGPRFLLVLSLLGGGSDAISAMIIDTDRALERFDLAERSDPRWREQVENEIFERACRSAQGFALLSDRGSLAHYFDRLVEGDLRELLQEAGEWAPFGSLTLLGTPPGMAVQIDGREVGVTSADRTELIDLRPGPRRLILEDRRGGGARFESTVEIARGQEARLDVSLAKRDGSAARLGTFWGGVALSAAGVAITSYALAARPPALSVRPCFEPGCEGQAAPAFATFCELASDSPSTCGGGVLAAPLGLGLAGAGAALIAGTLATDQELPWIAWIAAAAVGLGTYGIGAAAGR
jgi:hypothetical protein